MAAKSTRLLSNRMSDSSANLTKAAPTRNIALGILFANPSLALQIKELLTDLTDKEILFRL